MGHVLRPDLILVAHDVHMQCLRNSEDHERGKKD
tara:strand:+ start:2755 stop:2856 length:102 start_codon:yes stop_codon:yes gene_type:complete